ncbi:MAG: hypothetical protein ACI4PU_04335 [Intestinibacter sp.]
MRKYEMPQMYMEEFVPNQVIAACGDTTQKVDFTCLQGPNIDTYHVLSNDSSSTCTRRAAYTSSATVSKPTNSSYGYTRTNETGGGWYVICVPLNDSSSYDTSLWNLGTGVHGAGHSGNDGGGKGPGGGGSGQWHCMAAKVSNNVETVTFS